MSKESAGLEAVLLGRRPSIKPSPGGATFVEGVVDRVTADGLYFTLPKWDKGKFIFGPCPWPMSRIEPTGINVVVGANTVPTATVDTHAAHAHSTHSHTLTTGGSTNTSTVPNNSSLSHAAHDHGSHVHPGSASPAIHDHVETVPSSGDRCLVLFPAGDNDGVDGPWVIGWWPSE